MGYFSNAETWTVNEGNVAYSAVTTGDQGVDRQLLYQLNMCINKANKIDVIVSFLMTSGVKLLIKQLKRAVNRGARLRILTGNYLGITQPEALYLLRRELGYDFQLRMYNDSTRSFHPKAYIFEFDNCRTIFVGSSNISKSALTSGIEWNYCLQEEKDPDNYKIFCATFEELWCNHSLVMDDDALHSYSKAWHRPAVYKDMQHQLYDDSDDVTNVRLLYEPRGAQIEALYALNNLRQDGGIKGIVQAATGIGKTFLAAFDSQGFDRVLFVAHRKEILEQAAKSFRCIRPDKTAGFFMSEYKENDTDFVFASVATLGQPEYLNSKYFDKEDFDYIVIDEFHHAVNKQYKNIIEYFKPKFLLGLTATPERMDGRDIFALCDYNVPYEINLAEGINKGMLAPFRYYGIYDDTDYKKIEYNQGHYNIKSLNAAYIANTRRTDLIFMHYSKHKRKRALGFCCSREHAEMMAKEFCKRGVKAASVYSGSQGRYAVDREKALMALKTGILEVIFSVDMFNEGVDVKSIDLVMFLRPTESPVVFMQQLGRGLRIDKGKQYLVVLDFIGNYVKADRIQKYLSNDYLGNANKELKNYDMVSQSIYPDDCQVDFDVKLIDMFEALQKKKITKQKQIENEFNRICAELGGRHPTRIELFNRMDREVYKMCLSNSKINPFNDYLAFLNGQQCLTSDESRIYSSAGRDLVAWVEKTNMTKVYKMPVLMSLLHDGEVKAAVKMNDVLKSWKSFFAANRNWRDLPSIGSYQEFLQLSDNWHIKKILEMPIKYLQNSQATGIIKLVGGSEDILLEFEDRIKTILALPGLYEQLYDVLTYRVQYYYWQRYESKK